MAVYTTEVRTIAEQFAGRVNRAELDDIDGVIAESWEKIFGANWEIYDPEYKAILCGKILRHYWMREIGAESVGLWLHWLRTRMGEIMPYYNQLYKSATLEFNPLHDYELTHTSKRTTDGESTNQSVSEGTTQNSRQGENAGESAKQTTSQDNSTTESSNQNSTESQSSVETADTGKTTNADTKNSNTTNQNIKKYSDTPQGALTGVLNGTYLTEATVDDGSGSVSETANKEQNVTNSGTSSSEENVQTNGKASSTQTGSSQGSETATNSQTHSMQETGATTGKTDVATTAKTTEDYTLTVMGKTGGASYSKLLNEFRSTLLNIDMRIIDDLSDLFMGLWA